MSTDEYNFNVYIKRLVKEKHGKMGMTGDALATINNLTKIVVDIIVVAANILLSDTGAKTLSTREIKTATKMKLPHYIAIASAKKGDFSVEKYLSGDVEPSSTARSDSNVSKSGKKKPVQRADRAGLIFNVTRIEKLMMSKTLVDRKSALAAVYLTAVVEYVIGEILILAGSDARDTKRERISLKNIQKAIDHDIELNCLFKDTVISGVTKFDDILSQNSQLRRKVSTKKPKPVKKAPIAKKPTAKKTRSRKTRSKNRNSRR